MSFLRFEYVPYPLWRLPWPGPLRPMLRFFLQTVYPVTEDDQPPGDAAALADFLLRYRLLPRLSLAEMVEAMHKQQPPLLSAAPVSAAPVPQSAPVLPARIPAQWEPLQSVMLSWPLMYPPLWPLHAQMAREIARVARVQILVPDELWTQAVWLYLRECGLPTDCLAQIQFQVLPTDDIWVRDYGPIVAIDGAGQRVAFNPIYDHHPRYPQQRDNRMPELWGRMAGMPVLPLQLHTEGGNLWTDGAGTLIMSEQVFVRNPQYDRARLEAYLHSVFEYQKLIITPRLTWETTGHVDLVLKLAGPQTALISAPDSQSAAAQLKAAQTLFRREQNAHGQHYDLHLLPTPALYLNWFYYPIRRSYTNALTVNGRVLVPVYGISSDEQALRVYERAMPGYEIVPIDCKVGINGGGAVHCMTHEVPLA